MEKVKSVKNACCKREEEKCSSRSKSTVGNRRKFQQHFLVLLKKTALRNADSMKLQYGYVEKAKKK